MIHPVEPMCKLADHRCLRSYFDSYLTDFIINYSLTKKMMLGALNKMPSVADLVKATDVCAKIT